MITFVDIRRDGYYLALNASNVWYLTFNDHPKHHKINNLRNNSHTYGYDAMRFVGSMSILELTLTDCHKLVFRSANPIDVGGTNEQKHEPSDQQK